jgi:Outer membrane protein beta-barrel domain
MMHPEETPTRFSFRRLREKLASLLMMALAAAGNGYAGQVRLGLHGGLSVPNIRGGDNEFSQGYTSRLGPYFGVFGEYELRPHFWLQAGLSYASQGGKRDGMQPIIIDVPGLVLPPDLVLYADFHNEAILDYLEVPLLAVLTWGQKPRFFVNAGPYIGFLVRAKTVTSGMSTIYIDDSGTPLLVPPDFQPLPPVSFDATTDTKGDINELNAGIAGGIGLAVPAGPGEIVLGVRFSLGLTNIQTDVETYGHNRTGAIEVLVGYTYLLK